MKTRDFAVAAPALALFVGLFPTFAGEPALRSGIDKKHFDPAVRPQDDLFRSVNGRWLKDSVIPADRPAAGAFFELLDRTQEQVRAILEEAAKNKGDADAQKISDLYASFLDEARANQLGLAPVRPELDAVAAVKDTAGLIRELAALQRAGVPGLFDFLVRTDPKRSDRHIAFLEQGGLGLPDESYYRDPKYDGLRKAYVAHVGKMLALAEVPDPQRAAERIMALETAVAKSHWDNVQTRDEDKTYNRFSRAQVKALAKGIDLEAWFEGVGGKGIEEVIVREPSFLAGLAETVGKFPVDDWKTYLTWRVIRARAPLLSEPFVAEEFAFSGKTLLGTPQNQPRWKRGVALVERALGQAVGRLYVAKHFPPEAKGKMQRLVANLLEAYAADIRALDWMTAETKARALEKLAKFTPKIGYPDKWRDYSGLEIRRDDLVGNQRRAAAFALDYQLGKLGKPVDRAEWNATPQTVDAFYNAGMNEIVFPAAVLQPPFFDPAADDAVSYGGIGAVIGHEIGHGFDDQGSKYDGDGNLRDWWTAADKAEFQRRTRALIAQYSAFEPQQLPGSHVNGALTVGENIGDLGGVTIAHKAYLISLKGKAPPVIDGLTGPQRLFVGWAQVWRWKYRDAALSRMLATNPHSPPEFRCNGVVRNLTEFYDAFGVKEGDKLWLPPQDRVRIW
jgi:putative endopeptidase